MHTKERKPSKSIISANLQLLDEYQVVELGVCSSVNTLRSWRFKRVGPPFIKIRGLVRYRLSDIEQFLESCQPNVKVSA
jgi:hypothetical protein